MVATAMVSGLAPSLSQALDDFLACMIEDESPSEIVLFGSRMRGDARVDSDVDLLLVAGRDVKGLRRVTRSTIEGGGDRVLVELHMFSVDQLVSALRRGDTRVRDAIAEGRVLWPPSRHRVSEYRSFMGEWSVNEAVRQWLDLANEDIKSARGSQDRESWINAAYHSQQAVEKALKAYLLQLSGSPGRKTHDLDEIVADIASHDPEFGHMFRTEFSSALASFEGYAVDIRYPGAEPIDSDQSALAVELAERVVARVAQHLQQVDDAPGAPDDHDGGGSPS